MDGRLAKSVGNAVLAGIIVLVAGRTAHAQLLPSPPELAAKVMSLTGQVSVLHDSEPWALNVGDSIQTRQTIVTGPDGYALFQVSDGSTFEVFPDSTVIFRKNPYNWRDLLDLFVGRVKIHIQRMGGQPNPNRVHTPTAVISVRGTTFDVTVNSDDETTVIAVEEGAVDVRHALKGGEAKTVNAGETIQVFKNEPLASRFVDRGAVAQRLLRALNDALYTISTNSRLPKVSGTGVGVGNTKPLPPPGNSPTLPPPPVAPPH